VEDVLVWFFLGEEEHRVFGVHVDERVRGEVLQLDGLLVGVDCIDVKDIILKKIL
jgi:hypothetical protein